MTPLPYASWFRDPRTTEPEPRDYEADALLADRVQEMRDERVIEDRGWEP